MKYKIICKILVIIICLFEDKKNLIIEKAFSNFFIFFNIKKILICNLILNDSLFNCFFYYNSNFLKLISYLKRKK